MKDNVLLSLDCRTGFASRCSVSSGTIVLPDPSSWSTCVVMMIGALPPCVRNSSSDVPLEFESLLSPAGLEVSRNLVALFDPFLFFQSSSFGSFTAAVGPSVNFTSLSFLNFLLRDQVHRTSSVGSSNLPVCLFLCSPTFFTDLADDMRECRSDFSSSGDSTFEKESSAGFP